jgi:hypothetical protein
MERSTLWGVSWFQEKYGINDLKGQVEKKCGYIFLGKQSGKPVCVGHKFLLTQ